MLNSPEPTRVYASIFQLASAKLTLAAFEAAISCLLAPAKCKVEHAHCFTRKLKVVPDGKSSLKSGCKRTQGQKRVFEQSP